MPVHLDLDKAVATLRLDDVPRRNAMSIALGEALRARVDELSEARGVGAVVLTGAGGAFSAGGDLGMLRGLVGQPPEDIRRFMRRFYALFLSVMDLRVPVIAAIDGPAIGAGLCLAMACDVCVVAENATLALSFARLGLYPGMGATYLTPLRVGGQRATELLLTGRRFDGREAVTLGLAARATPSGATLSAAHEMASEIARGSPAVVRALVSALRPARAGLEAALDAEAALQAESFADPELARALHAPTS